MSAETQLDELELQLLPAWAKESPQTNRYAGFAGEREDRPGRDDRFGRGGPRGNRPPFGRGGGAGDRGPRRDGPGSGPRRDGPGGGPRGDRRPGGGRRFERGRDEAPRGPMPELPPLPELRVEVLPEPAGVESLARQIKLTGRAYPLFEIANLVVRRPERYVVHVSVKKNAEGAPVQPLFLCSLDDSLWLSEDEAAAHVLARHFATFYQTEKTPGDPPKGIYTFVAQCGMSGAVLGPPNYHDYQNKLRKLHAERFSRMPFDAFKARVKIVKDEAVVKQWIEEQSFKTEFICLNVPDALKLPTREEVEKHFRATHLANVVRPVEQHSLAGNLVGTVRPPGLRALIRRAVDEQHKFPIKIATALSQSFAKAGLAFFKVNKTITHVSVARPTFLDLEAEPVSDGVRRIIEFIAANARCTRRKLLDALAPAPVVEPVVEVAPTPVAEGAAPAPKPASPEPTPEQAAVITDLHWLIHQGNVIEFANGQMETAKKPLPRPEKPVKVRDAGYLPVTPAAALGLTLADGILAV
jgi:hypothetical protein